jgi:WD40 repeat protein
VIAGGSDGYVYMINATGQAADNQKLGGAVSALSVSDGAHGLIAGSTNGHVLHCLIKDRLQVLGSLEIRQPITSATLSEDGKRISFASLDGAISVFNRSLASPLWTFNAGAIVHSLSISSDGMTLAASSDTGSIYLFHESPLVQPEKFSYTTILVPTIIAVLVFAYLLLRRRRRSGGRRIVTEKPYRPARRSSLM